MPAERGRNLDEKGRLQELELARKETEKPPSTGRARILIRKKIKERGG